MDRAATLAAPSATLPVGRRRGYDRRRVFRDGGKMDLQTFRDSIAKPQPPAGSSPALQALWWDAKGDWDKAHQRAQERDDKAGMHVHAYLHRKEGDHSNAEYWYRRSGAAPSILTLDEEWEELARALLEQG
jgi:hypothetical protein